MVDSRTRVHPESVDINDFYTTVKQGLEYARRRCLAATNSFLGIYTSYLSYPGTEKFGRLTVLKSRDAKSPVFRDMTQVPSFLYTVLLNRI